MTTCAAFMWRTQKKKSTTFLYLASRPRPRTCVLSALCFVRDPYNLVVFGGFKYADLNQ